MENEKRQDYLEIYKTILSKVRKKKRFFRSNAISDSLDKFTQLMNELKREGEKQYAAFCALAIARCQEALENTTAQANNFSEAGQTFWESEIEEKNDNYLGFEENLTEAINCYKLAIDLYISKKMECIASNLYAEMAQSLKILHKYEEAFLYFQRAASIQEKYSVKSAIAYLKHASECKIEQHLFEAAVETLYRIINVSIATNAKRIPLKLHPSFYTDVTIESYITIFLIQLLQNRSKQALDTLKALKSNLSQWGITSNKALVSLLYTIADVHENKNILIIDQIQGEVCNFLTNIQNELLFLLVFDIKKPIL